MSAATMATRSTGRVPPLTELGMGVAQFGNLNRETTDEASAEAFDAAWGAGVRYFDTAPHYGLGLSERRLGASLAGHARDEYVLSTKVGRIIEPSPETAGRQDDQGFVVPASNRRRWDFSRDGILRSLEASLERLGLDRVDILYLHDPDDHWEAASTTGVDALVELREQGVVQAIGAGMNQVPMLTEFVRRCDVDLVMVAGRYTLLDREAADELLPLAAERGVGIVAAGVYNSGLLASDVPPADARYDYAPASDALRDRVAALARSCAEHGVTVPEAAVRFPLLQDVVLSAVIGCRTAADVTAAIRRATADVPAALWADLDADPRSR